MDLLSHLTLTEVPMGSVLFLLGMLTGGILSWAVGRLFESSKA